MLLYITTIYFIKVLVKKGLSRNNWMYRLHSCSNISTSKRRCKLSWT